MTSAADSQTHRSSFHRSGTTHILVWLGSALTVLAALLSIRSGRPILLFDLGGIALCAFGVLLLKRDAMLGWMSWICAGALVGAGIIGELSVAPYVLLATGVFVTAGVIGIRSPMPRVFFRIGIALLAGIANSALLWLLIFHDYRPLPATEFLEQDLRAHTLLADVPLHDVWAANLRGGPEGLTMMDVREVLIDGFRSDRNTGFFLAAAVRGILGYVLGWDEDRCRKPEASFGQYLTDVDHRRSIAPSDDRLFLYTFERESAIEIINCTVHAFVVAALEKAEGGYTLYWAFYVKPVGAVTSFYMALIQPFRTSIIYPSIIEEIERNWAELWCQ